MAKIANRINDVAKSAGVSVSTVSRVINNDLSVNVNAVRNVESAIQELNYKRMRTGNAKITGMKLIALVIPDILNPFFVIFIRGVENAARIQGYNIILCDCGNDAERENDHIKTLYRNRIKGILYLPSLVDEKLIDKMLNDDFSLVCLDEKIKREGICYVTSANEDGAYQAVKYLIKLGHKNIVHIAGPKHLGSAIDRLKGYKKALSESGIEINEDLIIAGDYNMEETFNGISNLIHRGISFTAIFAASDIMAFGARHALETKNIRIPEDVSLVGYDDVPFSTAISLTTVSQPAYEIGRNAMQLLNDLINERVKPPQHIVLRPSLIIRGSCEKK